MQTLPSVDGAKQLQHVRVVDRGAQGDEPTHAAPQLAILPERLREHVDRHALAVRCGGFGDRVESAAVRDDALDPIAVDARAGLGACLRPLPGRRSPGPRAISRSPRTRSWEAGRAAPGLYRRQGRVRHDVVQLRCHLDRGRLDGLGHGLLNGRFVRHLRHGSGRGGGGGFGFASAAAEGGILARVSESAWPSGASTGWAFGFCTTGRALAPSPRPRSRWRRGTTPRTASRTPASAIAAPLLMLGTSSLSSHPA